MSNVENYSTDLVCGRNRNDFTRNPLRETAHPFFLRKYSADRVSHTSAVDTTAHSIWRGKERRRMPTNPYRFDPHRSIQHLPLFLPRAAYIEDSATLRPHLHRSFCISPIYGSGGGRNGARSIGTVLNHRTLSLIGARSSSLVHVF